ncbi:unnamed protein product [Amaranthus hypochondriacus]
MVIPKAKNESYGPAKNAGTSKFKVYSEKQKINGRNSINGDAKILRTSLVSNTGKGTVFASNTANKSKVYASGTEATTSHNDTFDKTMTKNKVRRRALADVSNIQSRTSRFDKLSGSRNLMGFGTQCSIASSSQALTENVKPNLARTTTVSKALNPSAKANAKTLRESSNFHGVQVNKSRGTMIGQTSMKTNIITRNSLPPMMRASQCDYGDLQERIKANLTRGVTASKTLNPSAKVNAKTLRSSFNFHRGQVNETMETMTRRTSKIRNIIARKSRSPVMKSDSSDLQGHTRSAEKSTRKIGFPVKARAFGKSIIQVSNLKGKAPKEKVNDDFTLKPTRKQTIKDVRGGLKISVKPLAKTSVHMSNNQKNVKSKSMCTLYKPLGYPARRANVAASFAKTSNPIVSCEKVVERGIPTQSSDTLKPQSSDITASKRSRRRKSYTSSLISRSKLLELRNEAKEDERFPNIDDEGNPLEAAEYVDDIYEYYWTMEAQSTPMENYLRIQTDVTPQMRGLLINWLIEVHLHFDLIPETLYLTVALLDRYLSTVTVKKKELQLVGLACLLLASKYEDFWHPRVKHLISISPEPCTVKQMLETEKGILKQLKFRLNLPTAYVFMLRFLKASQSNKRHEHLAYYLIELCLVEYEALRFRPSLLCASAVYVARSTLHTIPTWTPLLEKHARYDKHQMRDCAEMILRIHKAASTGVLKVTHDKYLQPEFGSVAGIRPLDNLPV